MFDFFDRVIGFLEIIWSAIEHFFKSIFYLFELIIAGNSIQYVLVPLLPSIIGISFTIVIAVCVVKLIIGR